MKIVVGMDGNGHFNVARLEDREQTLEVLNAIDDGDYFENNKDDFDEGDGSIEAWESTMRNFEQRGTFEIIELK